MFPCQNIRPAQENFRRHAGRNLFGSAHAGQVCRQQFAGRRRTDQKVQGIFVLSHPLRETCSVSPGRVHLRLRAAQIQFRHKSDFIAPSNEIVGCLLRLKGGLSQSQVFPVGGKGQVGVCNGRYQQDLCAAATPLPWPGILPVPGLPGFGYGRRNQSPRKRYRG